MSGWTRSMLAAVGALGLVLPGCGSPAEPETATSGRQTAGSQRSPWNHPDFSQPQRKPLNLASTVWPPFSDKEGQPRVAIELVHAALQKAGFPARTTVLTDVETDEHLRDGSFDGSTAVWRTPEREGFLHFSEPFLENRIVLVARAGTDVSAGSLADVRGKRVAVVSGYAYGEAVQRDHGAVLVEGESTSDNMRALLDGQVDYVLADDLVVHYMLEQQPDTEHTFAIGTHPLARRTLHFTLRKDHPEAAAIIDSFNAQIERMLTDGSYHDILDLRSIRADVDGNGELELLLHGSQKGKERPKHAYRVDPGDDKPDSGTVYFVEDQSYGSSSWGGTPQQHDISAPTGSPGEYGIGEDRIVY